MDNFIAGINAGQPQIPEQRSVQRRQAEASVSYTRDSVSISGTPNGNQSIDIVVERAMAHIRASVSESAEAAGVANPQVLDTSAEATGQRIADFALGYYEQWRANHPEGSEEEARQAFADFIGSAVDKGVSEAKDILDALNAITEEVSVKIENIYQVIQERFAQFVEGAAPGGDAQQAEPSDLV